MFGKNSGIVFAMLNGWLFNYCASAFTPYENYILSGRETHVALFVQVKNGCEKDFAETLKLLNEKKTVKLFAKADIKNISAFQKTLNEKTYCLLYFDYKGGKRYLDAAKDFENSCPVISKLNEFIIPHPRAERYGCKWLQMEWICYIRGKDTREKSQNIISMVTRIKPEKEMEYRLMHQGVWPGVIDQMERGNMRNFSIFLVELENEIYEFFVYEYVGHDEKADNAMNISDAANLRWWKHTDQCQEPLPEVKGKGIWAPMIQIDISK